MRINKTPLSTVFEIESFVHGDDRGLFVKTFNSKVFEKLGLNPDFKESFYSISERNVIRGMHFQLPPMDHEKLVYVINGEIIDVVVDVREHSDTYGHYLAVQLNSSNRKGLYIGRGFAHGFLTKSDTATVHYLTTSVHSKDHDTGIRWNSFDYDWGVADPIVSQRDQSFGGLR